MALLVGLSLFDLYYHLRTKETQLAVLQGQVDSIFRDLSRGATVSNAVGQGQEKLREIEANLKGVGTLSGPQGSALRCCVSWPD